MAEEEERFACVWTEEEEVEEWKGKQGGVGREGREGWEEGGHERCNVGGEGGRERGKCKEG